MGHMIKGYFIARMKALPDRERAYVVLPQGFSHDLIGVERNLQNFGIVVFFRVLTFRKSDHLLMEKNTSFKYVYLIIKSDIGTTSNTEVSYCE